MARKKNGGGDWMIWVAILIALALAGGNQLGGDDGAAVQPPAQVDVDTARTVLPQLTVVPDGTEVGGYDRDAFGQPWADVDRNGCDTRNDMLARDLDNIVHRTGSNCVIESGVLDPDPYTGEKLVWKRGGDVLVDIDHIVPLSRAWSMGASTWDDQTRLNFANDPINLLAVDGPANRAKGDKSPSHWMPANDGYHCAYAASYIMVTDKYDLSVTTVDHQVLARAMETCP